MSRSNRWQSLRQRADFLYLQKQGRKWITPAFILHACSDADVTQPHVGFTVTKKLGTAVVRNRIRRRLRAAIDEISKENLLPKWKISLTARADALDKEFAELVRDAKWALRKLQEKKQEKRDDE